MLLHISAFRFDIDSQRQTLWHRLTPQTRILGTLLLVFAIALTPNGRWLTWGVYSLGLLAIVLVSQVTLGVLLRRVAIELVFVGVVVLGTLFRDGGEVVWHWGWLRVTSEGLMILGSVTLKAAMSLVLVNVLILTTSIPALLHALAALRVPPLLVAILAAMYRYLAVLTEEFYAMRRAAISRNLLGSRRWQRLVIGHMMGSLFIRTLDRGERVHQAMLARGYTGLPPIAEVVKPTWRDRVVLTLIAALTLSGQAIYLLSLS